MIEKIKWVWRYARPQRRGLAVIVFLTAVSAAISVVQPWPLKILADYALGGSNLPDALQPIRLRAGPNFLIFAAALASLVLYALNSGIEAALAWNWSVCGQRTVQGLATEMFHRLQRLSLPLHSRRNVGDSLSRLAGDSYCVYTVMQAVLIRPGQYLLTLVAIIAVAWQLDHGLTLLLLSVAPVQAAFAFLYSPRLRHRGEQERRAQSRLMSFVHQTLTAIPLVQAFGANDRNRNEFQRLAAEAVTLSQRGVLIVNTYGFFTELILTAGNAVVLYAGSMHVAAGPLSLGSFLVFIAYMRSLQAACRGLLASFATLKSVESSIDRVTEILNIKDPVIEATGAKPLPVRPLRERGHIQLEAVTFGYEPECPVLRDVTLDVRTGEMVALIGPTGAGKSTLVSLIPRFFDPWKGRVLVDGVDVRNLRITELRAQIAIVLQEPFLLSSTIAENIAYGRPDASRDEVMEAALAANANEFIERLPAGYDTVIDERGASLSGGQKQRIAIARALLKNAPILILDEPTSDLDPATEALLLEALERLIEGRTTIMIAHRLSTIRRAGRIAVLDRGKVVEVGTHEQLMASAGSQYRAAHVFQFGEPANGVAG